MLLKKDVKVRHTWYGKAIQQNLLSQNFWQAEISMYVDGAGLEYKSNPYEHAKCLKKKEQMTIWEGLQFGCTSKENKEGKYYVIIHGGYDIQKGSCDVCSSSTNDDQGLLLAVGRDRNINSVKWYGWFQP